MEPNPDGVTSATLNQCGFFVSGPDDQPTADVRMLTEASAFES